MMASQRGRGLTSRRHNDAFEGKRTVLRVRTVEGNREVSREITVINFDGVLVAVLFANDRQTIR